jgi:hypothetical protein
VIEPVRKQPCAETLHRSLRSQCACIWATLKCATVEPTLYFRAIVLYVYDQVREVSFDDNVKQDKSIDVYGRDADNADEVEKLANL